MAFCFPLQIRSVAALSAKRADGTVGLSRKLLCPPNGAVKRQVQLSSSECATPLLSSPTPADNSLRSHNKQRLSPVRPDSREPDPKAAVEPSQPGSWALSLHHCELLPEGQILPSQFFKAR